MTSSIERVRNRTLAMWNREFQDQVPGRLSHSYGEELDRKRRDERCRGRMRREEGQGRKRKVEASSHGVTGCRQVTEGENRELAPAFGEQIPRPTTERTHLVRVVQKEDNSRGIKV